MEFVLHNRELIGLKNLNPAVLLLIRTQQEYGRLAMDIRAVYMRGCRYRRNRQGIY